MIDYISLTELNGHGAIQLHDGEKIVGMSNGAWFLAELIRKAGGSAKTVRASSGFIEASCGDDESAQEYGFKNAEELINLWDRVCAYQ